MSEIRTVAELDALPEKSVVIDKDDDAWQKKSGEWYHPGESNWESERLLGIGPLTLAHRPSLPHTVITDVEAIEALPVGAVLAGDGMHWQKQSDGYWYPSSFSWIKQRGALFMAGIEPTLIWLPKEATR